MNDFQIEVLPGTPLGSLYFALSESGLAGLAFDGPGLKAWRGRFPAANADIASGALAGEVRAQLSAYFSGQRRIFDLPLDLSRLSDFQTRVLSAVSDVPFGHTSSYREIASRIGRPRAYRAVGGANAANPIAIVIPCHRLVGVRGSLRGYGGGLDRKAWLLAHESRFSRVE
jgi:O-6-methylguanine DNA methyltransferase